MIFADTGAFAALLREKDRHHRAAKEFLDASRILVTTDYVIDETATLLLSRVGRRAASLFLDAVAASRLVRLELVGREGFEEARDLFVRRMDKGWSFTDCSSFAVMRRLRIREAFAFDAHFEQAGFRRVP